MLAWSFVEYYDDLVRRARARARAELAPLRTELGGDEVQMSVRLPVGLRTAISDAAARNQKSVTGFVIEILERAVTEESDPFAGLAADLAGHTRALLAEAVEAGDYADAAAEVDAAEERSAAG
jgi:hypothetical protein